MGQVWQTCTGIFQGSPLLSTQGQRRLSYAEAKRGVSLSIKTASMRRSCQRPLSRQPAARRCVDRVMATAGRVLFRFDGFPCCDMKLSRCGASGFFQLSDAIIIDFVAVV